MTDESSKHSGINQRLKELCFGIKTPRGKREEGGGFFIKGINECVLLIFFIRQFYESITHLGEGIGHVRKKLKLMIMMRKMTDIDSNNNKKDNNQW